MIKKLDEYTKEELIDEIKSLKKRKSFGLVWENKPENVAIECAEKLPVVEEVIECAIKKADENDRAHLIIEGDNYHSLSVLNYTHANKVDVIYIDPPYNTGNKDFIYNDRFIDEEDPYKHSKWLSFMSKRLKLASKLLNNSGAMFISIDDHEYANLKLLCDSIFGEDLVETYIWNLSDPTEGSFVKTSGNTVRKEHEYIIACFKSKGKKFNKYSELRFTDSAGFSNPDNDPRGDWMSGNISRNGIKTTTGSKYFTITTPSGVKYTRNWTLSKNEFDNLVADNRIFFARGGDGVPRIKIFKEEPSLNIQSSIFTGVHTSITGKNQLKALFDGKAPFDFPKPTDLIKRLITIASGDNAVVLDYFAGSGTTGQAVMELNKADGGRRQFIVCTNNENKIAEEITYPRIKKVIDGYGEVSGIPANVYYFRTVFVEKSKTPDRLKRELSPRCEDMIRIREGNFNRIIDEEMFKVYKSANRLCAIVFDRWELAKYINKLDAMDTDEPVHLYVFSYDKDDRHDEMPNNTKHEYQLQPIPEGVLEIYRKIFRSVAKGGVNND